jgi:oligoendopeptidase F
MTKKTEYQLSNWSLKDLFPSPESPELETAFKSLKSKVVAFEKNRSLLTESTTTEQFLKIIKQMESIDLAGNRLASYPELWFAEDTQSQAAQTLAARVQQFVAELSNRVLFFSLWWKSISDNTVNRLLKGSGDYRYWLEQMRQFKPHTLSEPEEKIVNLKNVTGVNSLVRLYESITNRYVFKVEVKGKIKKLSRGELMTLVRQADPDLRKRAYQELYRVYGKDGPILGQMYQTLVRDWHSEQVQLRKYSSPIAARNLINDIPDAVVNTLLDVCQKNAVIFQNYFELKAHWLNMKCLRRYDLYAPVAKSKKTYEFGQAAGMIFEAFEGFDPRFAEYAEQVLKEKHLDSEIRPGKRTGAFCATITPDLTPWVHVNYQGKADDVATLAHELGHAIHAQMAKHHSVYTQSSCLPLAETASTFGEMMLVDKLLKEESDEAVRRDILFRQIDDAYATIQRQSSFALFERQAHEMVLKDARVDDLAEAYLKNLKTQFGKSVKVSDIFRWEWVSIPHIYNVPFYVYAYTFGQLLVFSLYQQYKKEGDSFKPKLIKILATGGSQAPVEMLKEAGVDVSKAAFWQGGYDVVSGLIKQLEQIKIQ